MNEDAAREQLATCTRIFAMHGLLGMFGHISVFLPESQRVVICPGSGAEKCVRAPGQEEIMARRQPRRRSPSLTPLVVGIAWFDAVEWAKLKQIPDEA